MRKHSMRIWLVLVVILLYGCVPFQYLGPADGNSFYYQDHEVVLSHGDSTLVAVYGLLSGGEVILHIACRNYSTRRIDIIPNQIKITAYNEKGDSTNIKPYSANAYLMKMRFNQSLSLALIGIGGTMKSTYVDDPVAKAMYEGQTENTVQRTADQQAQYAIKVESGLLRANTLFPGQIIEGNLMAQYDSYHSAKFKVVIPLSGEDHTFIFLKR